MLQHNTTRNELALQRGPHESRGFADRFLSSSTATASDLNSRGHLTIPSMPSVHLVVITHAISGHARHQALIDTEVLMMMGYPALCRTPSVRLYYKPTSGHATRSTSIGKANGCLVCEPDSWSNQSCRCRCSVVNATHTLQSKWRKNLGCVSAPHISTFLEDQCNM